MKREYVEKAAAEAALLRLDTSMGRQPQLVCGTNCSVELRLLDFSWINLSFANSHSERGPLPITNELEESWICNYFV